MKRIILAIICLFLAALNQTQAQSGYVCRLGFTYFISTNNNWGKGKPVIDRVFAYSPAEQAGLKPFDILNVIDGVPVEQITPDEIPLLLNPSDKNEVALTISNTGTESGQVLLRKDCIRTNAIMEDQLAAAFNMYSLESTVERSFTCPFKTTVTPDPVDFIRFKTYKFADIDESNRALETTINDCISTELAKKGLILSTNNPDIIIQTYYLFNRNPNFRGSSLVRVKKEPVFRYNIAVNRFEVLPFLNPAIAESEVEYLLQLGIRLIDQKVIPGRVLWECEANELMENSFRLEDYARMHIPLMCMQYPFVTYTRNCSYTVSDKAYNYTGISYNIDRLEQVADVAPNSPAYAAGIRAGDIIEKIGKHKMNYSAEELTRSYKYFINRTMEYRDPKTLFTDANGFDQCMYWDTFKYPQIADVMQKADYNPVFSYLYYFAPYINPGGNNACTFSIKRGKEKKEVVIRPNIRTETVVEVK